MIIPINLEKVKHIAMIFLVMQMLNTKMESLHIRGKTYDPKPYGYTTNISVWVKNSAGETVFADQRNNSLMYSEGEWTTGEQMLHERAGAIYYMPEDFTSEILWTSNGKWTGQSDVINSMSKGSGFVFFSGHGSPRTWGDQYFGIPGNRKIGSVKGLACIAFTLPFSSLKPPFFPMNKITNDYKNPIVIVGGCHNSDFNITLLSTLLDQKHTKSTWCMVFQLLNAGVNGLQNSLKLVLSQLLVIQVLALEYLENGAQLEE